MITEIALIIALGVMLYVIYSYRKEVQSLKFMNRSMSTKYGKMSEQFMPFLDHYPYDKNRFRFIGSPVDGVQFEDDKIVFVEFKSGSSTMSTRQRSIRDLIKDGKIEFKELRI
jgi:predicted Holliday junction resolvase-like endonuclease